MELVNEYEIKSVLNHFGPTIQPLKWYFEEFHDKYLGNLGDHLKLIVEVENSTDTEKLRFFVKCMPRNNEWKSEYLKKLKFFEKEFIMLSSLFKQFQDNHGVHKWRPKLLYVREDLFIFEDAANLGYVMPNNCDTMKFEDLKATIQTLAKFHAATYILEEKKSREIGRPYRIWEDYSEHLQEPIRQDWRDTGRNAIIDFLKVFSKYKNEPSTLTKAELLIPMLFDKAMYLMKPSNEYRNVVVHRDLWSNNIMIKRYPQSEPHVIIVDFQTVLYASPMLDLTSLIYFNTTKSDRDKFSSIFIDIYYNALSSILQYSSINIDDIFSKEAIFKSYRESIVFGITQAALIVPIVAMNNKKREEIFCDPVKSVRANVVSRSEDFIAISKEDSSYRNRVSELFDEIVERYVISKDTLNC